MKLLLSYETIDVDAEDWLGGTALTTAALWGYNEIIKMLLAAGADLEHAAQWTMPSGATALKSAALWGYDDTVQVGSLPSYYQLLTLVLASDRSWCRRGPSDRVVERDHPGKYI